MLTPVLYLPAAHAVKVMHAPLNRPFLVDVVLHAHLDASREKVDAHFVQPFAKSQAVQFSAQV